MLRTTAIALALTATAGAALAAGPEPVVVEEVVVVDVVAPFWAGGYVGGQIGWGYSDFDFGDLTDDLTGAVEGDFDGNDSGVVGGITAGYLWSLNNGWYLGPEFQYDWADISATADSGESVDFDEIARLKLIAGYEMGNGLLYGTAGVAYGSLDEPGDIIDGFDGSDTNWVAGFGYDYRVGENWTVGGEYLYHDFDDVNLNTLEVRLMYRF